MYSCDIHVFKMMGGGVKSYDAKDCSLFLFEKKSYVCVVA